MRGLRCLPVVLFVWGLGVATAFAVSADDLARALREAERAPNPPAAFWRAVRAMPDFTLTGDDLRRAVETAGTGAVDPVFAGLVVKAQSFTKRGDQVAMDVSRDVSAPDAALVTDRNVRFRILEGPEGGVRLDAVEGVRFTHPGATTEARPATDFTFRSEGDRPLMDVAVTDDRGVRRQLPLDLGDFGIRNGRGIVGRLDRGYTAPVSSQGDAPVAVTSDSTTTAPVTTSTSDIAANASSSTYTIEMGDTLWDIGQAYGMTVEQILDYDGGTGIKNSERLRRTAKSARHRGDPDWIWHPQQILLPRREEAPTPKRHTWGRRTR